MDWILSREGVGPKRAQAFFDAGLRCPEDMLRRAPASYRDWHNMPRIADLHAGDVKAFAARVRHVSTSWAAKGLAVTRARLEDETGAITAVFFNQSYRQSQLQRGCGYFFYGRVERRGGMLSVVCPIVEEHEPRGIEPVYALPEGVPAKLYARIVREALDDAAPREALPDYVLETYHLPHKADALRGLHMPDDVGTLLEALRRERFESLFLFQLGVHRLRGGTRPEGKPIPCTYDDTDAITRVLPYKLTEAQCRVLGEIIEDINKPVPMARMVQGDVGSGKTIVAFCALYLAAKAGYQAALMAPTEVLVAQHEAAARALLTPMGLRIGRLSGSHTAKQRRMTLAAIAAGEIDIIIGTHALFVKDVQYKKLALVITDEQHRFGVAQRQALAEKGDHPHMLVMSATPIPRSLALILHGDLDVSLIDTLPPGRKPIKTRIVPEEKRAGMYGFMLDQVRQGRQCYIVCPLIEESAAVEAASAIDMRESAERAMPGARIGLLHGGMSASQKEEALMAFAGGDIDVLVSTTVVEVGVNVPNATVMVVEDAERFGLAQLHQLRGRIGRGEHESWCFLMAQGKGKLSILADTNDGFVIAKADLEQRGPGDVYGVRQSGAPGSMDMPMGSDMDLIIETRAAVETYVKNELFYNEDTENAALKAFKSGGLSFFIH